MNKKNAFYGVVLSISLHCFGASAAGGSTTVASVDLSVIVQREAACTINNGQPATVEFGDNLITTNIDGQHYLTKVNLAWDCGQASMQDALWFSVSGVGAPFDSEVLKTDKTDLGIKLLVGNTQLRINDHIAFNRGTLPELYAVPVKNSGATLSPGEFNAVVTLSAEYQ